MRLKPRAWRLAHRSARGEQSQTARIEIAELESCRVAFDGGSTYLYFNDADGALRLVAAVAHLRDDGLPGRDLQIEWTIELDGVVVDDEESLADLAVTFAPFSGPQEEIDTEQWQPQMKDSVRDEIMRKHLENMAHRIAERIETVLERFRASM